MMLLFGNAETDEITYWYSSRFDTTFEMWGRLCEDLILREAKVDSVSWNEELGVYDFKLNVNDIKEFIRLMNQYKAYDEGKMTTVIIHLRPSFLLTELPPVGYN